MPITQQNKPVQDLDSQRSIAQSTTMQSMSRLSEFDINKDNKVEKSELVIVSQDVTKNQDARKLAHTLSQTALYNAINSVDNGQGGITQEKLVSMMSSLKLPELDISGRVNEKSEKVLKAYTEASFVTEKAFENSNYLHVNSNHLDRDKLKNAEIVIINSNPINKEILEDLSKSTKLKKLMLHDASLEDYVMQSKESKEKFKEVLSKLESLALDETQTNSSLWKNDTLDLPNLRELSYHAARHLYTNNIFSNTPNLEKLSIHSGGLQDKDLKKIATLSHIKQLNLSDTGISDAGLSHLKNLSNLELLDLSYTKINGKGLSVFAESRIKELNVSGTALDEKNISHLATCPELETIIFRTPGSGNLPNISNDLISIVNKISSIKTIKINSEDALDISQARKDLFVSVEKNNPF